MIPAATSVAVVEEELRAANAWAARHELEIEWAPESLSLRTVLKQPGTNELFYLLGVFDDYKAMAPGWTFTDDKWTAAPRLDLYPKITHTPYRSTLIITHGQRPVICAHFNRYAYGSSGPHSEWDAANWINAAPGYVRGATVGEMIQAIHRDFMLSRGRLP